MKVPTIRNRFGAFRFFFLAGFWPRAGRSRLDADYAKVCFFFVGFSFGCFFNNFVGASETYLCKLAPAVWVIECSGYMIIFRTNG